jgi:hypothetical protein
MTSVLLGFSDTARTLGEEVRQCGLDVPGFRSPPRLPGVTRSIRRLPLGAVVAVSLSGRAPGEVVADMIEGVVAANRLTGPPADALRVRLQDAMQGSGPSGGGRGRLTERQCWAGG